MRWDSLATTLAVVSLLGCQATPGTMRSSPLHTSTVVSAGEPTATELLTRIKAAIAHNDPPGTVEVTELKITSTHLTTSSFTAIKTTRTSDGHLSRSLISGWYDEQDGNSHVTVDRDLTPLPAEPKALKAAIQEDLKRHDVADAFFYELESVSPCPEGAKTCAFRARQHHVSMGGVGGQQVVICGTIDRQSREIVFSDPCPPSEPVASPSPAAAAPSGAAGPVGKTTPDGRG